ncbi:MAG: hypothetical protein H6502_03310 [Candidatus Woesearchaeota archaeon]|nr:MAG: hypothetical protein H6502_03310 [Candidatus Woesearchaeota archaeon]
MKTNIQQKEVLIVFFILFALALGVVFSQADLPPPGVDYAVHEIVYTDIIDSATAGQVTVSNPAVIADLSATAITLGGTRNTQWPVGTEGCLQLSLTANEDTPVVEQIFDPPASCADNTCTFRAVFTHRQGAVVYNQKNYWGTLYPMPVLEGEEQASDDRVAVVYSLYGQTNPPQYANYSLRVGPSGSNTIFVANHIMGSCEMKLEDTGEWKLITAEYDTFFDAKCTVKLCS